MAEIDATPAELLTWAEEAKSVIDGGLPEYEMRKATVVVALLRSAAAPQPGMRAEGEALTVPYNPCLAKLRADEPFFVLLGRDKQAPNAIMTWANDRTAAEGKSPWTEQAREVAYRMAAYSGAATIPAASPAEATKRDWVNCPICDEPDMCCETFDEGATLIHCTNHGCPSNKRASASPKPVPDAMREALIGRLEKGPYPVRWKTASPLTEEDRQDIVAILSETAPVPPPDGAAEVSYNPKLVAEIKSADAAEPEAKFSNAKDMLDWLSGPSDDVRSTLATAREEIVLTIAFLGRDAGSDRIGSTITGLIARLSAADKAIIAALRSAPVSVPATREAIQSAADYLYEETTKLDAPISMTACLVLAKHLLRAPAVGVTREAVARIIDPEAFEGLGRAPETGSEREYAHECEQRKVEALTKANAIIRSPAPDATVSEPDESRYLVDIIKNAMLTMWNEICSDTGHHPLDIKHGARGRRLYFAPRHWADMTAKMAASQILKLNLPSSPQHVGREEAVSNEDHRKAVAHFLCRLNQQWLSTDPCWHTCKMCLEPGSRWFEWADKLIALAPVSARDAVIEELQRTQAWLDTLDGVSLPSRDVLITWYAERPSLRSAIRSLAGAKP